MYLLDIHIFIIIGYTRYVPCAVMNPWPSLSNTLWAPNNRKKLASYVKGLPHEIVPSSGKSSFSYFLKIIMDRKKYWDGFIENKIE